MKFKLERNLNTSISKQESEENYCNVLRYYTVVSSSSRYFETDFMLD